MGKLRGTQSLLSDYNDYDGVPLDDTDDQDERSDGGDADDELRLLRTDPKKSRDDQLLINAITQAMKNTKREWSVPDKFSIAFTLIGGVGSIATTVADTIIGESLRLKELVPLSKKRWATFSSTTMAGGYIESIPFLNMVGGPVMATLAALAEKKGAAGVVRSAGKTAAAGAIDSALGVASLGGYSIYQLSTAWLASGGAIWLKAKFFYETYEHSAMLFEARATQLQNAFENAENVKFMTVRQVKKKIDWLNRQKRKCQERGKFYQSVVQKAEQKFDEGVAKIKAKLNIQPDEMKQPLLARGGRSDDD